VSGHDPQSVSEQLRWRRCAAL